MNRSMEWVGGPRLAGTPLPLDDVRGEQCMYSLIKAYGETGRDPARRERLEATNG